MTKEDARNICMEHEIEMKDEFLQNLSKEDFNEGMIKFNIPDEENIESLNGEGVWGWCTSEDKEKYFDDSYHGEIKSILANSPFNYMGKLFWGCEVVLQCHGDNRPTLSPRWIKEKLLNR
jgi:hypothetical protein